MAKKTSIWVWAALAGVGVYLWSKNSKAAPAQPPSKNSNGSTHWTFTQADSGKTVTMKVGDTLSFSIATPPGVAYSSNSNGDPILDLSSVVDTNTSTSAGFDATIGAPGTLHVAMGQTAPGSGLTEVIFEMIWIAVTAIPPSGA